MNDSTKENAEKAKALKKLIRHWLMAQETQRKAGVLLAKNPDLKVPGKSGRKKI